jgi:hypothetical protein
VGPTQSHSQFQFQSSRDEKKTRTRAGKPKVRTGCITCKIRRVKCDENRPSCNRCIRFGMPVS